MLVGLVVGVGLAIFRDQLSSSLSKLSQRNIIDAESLAYSRTHFERLVRQDIANHPESVLTVGLIQLSGIEEYYDSLPQAYINQIMRKVNETMKYQLRGNDVVGRWSQLQFSVFLPSTDGLSAKRRMARISEVLGQTFSLDANGEFDVKLDPRIGLADRQNGEFIPVLMSRAEEALGVSLQSSEEKVCLFKIQPFGLS